MDLTMIGMRDTTRAVARNRLRDIVLAAETSISALADVTDDVALDWPIPAIWKGSSVAHGVALAQPVKRMIPWDGDGSLRMIGDDCWRSPQEPRPHRS